MTQTTTTTSPTATADAVLEQATELGALVPVTAVELPMLVCVSDSHRVVTVDRVKPEHRAQLNKIADEVVFRDTNQVLTFAAAVQQKYVNSLKALLGGLKVEDAGQAGDITVQLAECIDFVGMDDIKAEVAGHGGFKNWLATMPLIGPWFSHIYTFVQRQQELVGKINQIERQARADMGKLIENNARLDQLLVQVEGNYYELAVYIVAGERALQRGRDEYEALRQAALASGDALENARVNTLYTQLLAFDNRLMRMKTAYVSAPVTGQKVMLTQQASRTEVQNIMDSLLFDLPQMLEAIASVVALYQIKQAQKNDDDRRAASKRIAELNDHLLGETVSAASERQARAEQVVLDLEARVNKIIDITRKKREADATNERINREAEAHLERVQQTFLESMRELHAPTALHQ